MNISHLISLITFPYGGHGALAAPPRKDIQEAHSEDLSLQAQCQNLCSRLKDGLPSGTVMGKC